jgi:transglutaminase-like putative cysteine protease
VPRSRQLTIDARLEVRPAARLSRYWDYWGTLVHAFDVDVRHSELVVVATAKVDTPPAVESDEADLGWAALVEPAVLDRYYEYLAPTATVPLDPDLAGVVEDLRALATTPRDGVRLVMDWVGGHLAYEKGSTSVSTSAVEAWRAGRGVCQDFVHLTLALLRGLGIPARYASGYLHPMPDAAIGETVTGDSHAWAEAWTGAGARSTPPTACAWASATCSWPEAATTATSLPSAASSSPGGRPSPSR